MDSLISLEACLAYQTHPGVHGSINYEACYANPEEKVFALARGLGRAQDAYDASHASIFMLKEYIAENGVQLYSRYEFAGLMNAINNAFMESESSLLSSMTVLTMKSQSLHIAHIGDCAVHLFNTSYGTKLTSEHTLAKEVIDRLGFSIHRSDIPDYYNTTLTRSLGAHNEFDFEYIVYPIESDEIWLMHTEGLSRSLDFDELNKFSHQFKNPSDYLNHIFKLAIKRGTACPFSAITFFNP